MQKLGKTALNFQMPDGREFTWGPVLAIHNVGPYAIIEYARDNSTTWGSDMDEIRQNHGKTQFHAYYDGRDISWACDSLEDMLVTAIAYKKHHVNSQLAQHFMTVIKADGKETLTMSIAENPYQQEPVTA